MEDSIAEVSRNMTLTQFILASQQRTPKASGKFSVLLHAIENASKYTAAKVKAAGLTGLFGLEGGTNSTATSPTTAHNDAHTTTPGQGGTHTADIEFRCRDKMAADVYILMCCWCLRVRRPV